MTLNDEARADAAISDPDLLFTSIEAAATQQGAPRCRHHSRARGRRAAPHTHRSAPLPPHTLAVDNLHPGGSSGAQPDSHARPKFELRVPALGHGPRRSPCALLPFPQEERKLRTPQLSWVDTCSSRHKPAPRKSPVTGGYMKINNVGHRDLAEDPECVHVGTPLLAHIRYLLVWGTPQPRRRGKRRIACV